MDSYKNKFTILNVKNMIKEKNVKVSKIKWIAEFSDKTKVNNFCEHLKSHVPILSLDFKPSTSKKIEVDIILMTTTVPRHFEKLSSQIEKIIKTEGGNYKGYKFVLIKK